MPPYAGLLSEAHNRETEDFRGSGALSGDRNGYAGQRVRMFGTSLPFAFFRIFQSFKVRLMQSTLIMEDIWKYVSLVSFHKKLLIAYLLPIFHLRRH